MFAAALWSKSQKRIVLARDRMGIKPLYVARKEEELFFASELKALFIHPEMDRRLSLAGLDCYLALNYIPSPWTLVEGIEKLAPGGWLEWRGGEGFTRCGFGLSLRASPAFTVCAPLKRGRVFVW